MGVHFVVGKGCRERAQGSYGVHFIKASSVSPTVGPQTVPLKNGFPGTTIYITRFVHFVIKESCTGRLGGSVRLAPDFGSRHDLTVHGFEPHVGLCAAS